jgi:hypothetical protein
MGDVRRTGRARSRRPARAEPVGLVEVRGVVGGVALAVGSPAPALAVGRGVAADPAGRRAFSRALSGFLAHGAVLTVDASVRSMGRWVPRGSSGDGGRAG